MSDLPPHPDDSPLAPSPYAPALAVTGLLMLGVLLIMANPGFGVKERVWPWEQFVQGHNSLLVESVLMLWILTGFWCLGMAFTTAARVRGIGAAMLGSVLLVECTAGFGGLTVEQYNLNNMLPMIVLGGGLLIAREPATRRQGALLAGFGAVLLLWALATGFVDGRAASQLEVFLEEFGIVLRDPAHEFERLNHLWWSLIPQALVLQATLGGLLALVGVRHRTFLLVVFWLLLAGVFFSGVAGTVLLLREGGGFRALLEQFSETIVTRGGGLWLLGAYTLQDLGKARALAEAA